MGTGLIQTSRLRRGVLAFGVVLLAYAILLRGLAPPPPGPQGSLEAALANPHYLCLTEGPDRELPSHGAGACGECCLGMTRADAPPPVSTAVLITWPSQIWRPAALPCPAQGQGPPAEAWTQARSQRGPPESRTPTSFT